MYYLVMRMYGAYYLTMRMVMLIWCVYGAYLVQAITGNTSVGFDDMDIDGDFDPDQWDKKMAQVFSNEYYDQHDHGKPTFEKIPGIDDDHDQRDGMRDGGGSFDCVWCVIE
jgi:hypothetical protein